MSWRFAEQAVSFWKMLLRTVCACSVWPGLALAGQKFGAGVGNGIGEMLSSVLLVSHRGIMLLQCP